jgi:hypothetical protein
MKLYRKKLDSLEALKREQIRLRYERKGTRFSDLVPLTEVREKRGKHKSKLGLVGSIMEIATAKSDIQMMTALAKPVLKMLGRRKSRKKEVREALGLPEKPSFLKRLLKEIAIGYITGKAVLMAVQGIRLWLNRRKAVRIKVRAKPAW